MNQLNVLYDVKLLWSAIWTRLKSQRREVKNRDNCCVLICVLCSSSCAYTLTHTSSSICYLFGIQNDSSHSLIYSRWTMRKYLHKQIAGYKFRYLIYFSGSNVILNRFHVSSINFTRIFIIFKWIAADILSADFQMTNISFHRSDITFYGYLKYIIVLFRSMLLMFRLNLKHNTQKIPSIVRTSTALFRLLHKLN